MRISSSLQSLYTVNCCNQSLQVYNQSLLIAVATLFSVQDCGFLFSSKRDNVAQAFPCKSVLGILSSYVGEEIHCVTLKESNPVYV